ncbi:glutamate 5-kinase [Halorussus salinisoli]|uniref:glutamate 5-kinase n=1 Tax=Halorussus salinisoli TaxID=2558242 RepID=UPI0010C1E86E|nr:glutamate 5-kinase [Halorussus salinisoli]
MSESIENNSVEIETVDSDIVNRTRELAADAQRVVVKAGTNSLTDGASNLDTSRIDKLVGDVVGLLEQDKQVILVSSGAVGAGKGQLGFSNETIEESQALSTIGQSQIMRCYTESFDRYDQTVAQILLTENDFEDPDRFTNFTNTIETLLEWGVIPVINENDAVATEELRIGDNDMLSSSVAIGVDADLLITLTDVGGVYTDNPKENLEAERIEAVGSNYAEVQQLIDDSSTASFGGIQTKVTGARSVSEHGIPAVIAKFTEPDVLAKIGTSKAVGTIFVPTNGLSNNAETTQNDV